MSPEPEPAVGRFGFMTVEGGGSPLEVILGAHSVGIERAVEVRGAHGDVRGGFGGRIEDRVRVERLIGPVVAGEGVRRDDAVVICRLDVET